MKYSVRQIINAKNSHFIKRVALTCGAIGFGLGLVLTLRNHPDLIRDIRWQPAVLILFIGIPLTLLANATEFTLMSASVGHHVQFKKALDISIIASAANMLPIPGGAVTRVAWLKSIGVDLKLATIIIFIFGLIWLGLSFFLSGICILSVKKYLIASSFILFGLSVLFSCVYRLVKLNVQKKIISQAVLQRFFITLIEAFRIWLCFQALGLEMGIIQAGIFIISGVVGSAVSIVPAGLGVREGISALMSPIAGIAMGSGFLAAALNRILALMFLAPLALCLSLVNKHVAEDQTVEKE